MRFRDYFYYVLISCFIGVTSALPAAAEEAQHGDGHGEGAVHETEPLNFFDFSSETSHPLSALLFNFAALVIIVYLLMKKPLGIRFRKRKEELVAALEEAEAAKKRAEEAIAAARAKMAAIDDEVAQLRRDIIAAGEKESAEIIARAEKQAERLLEETEKLVTHEITLMTQNLKREIVEDIVARASAEIQTSISKKDHERLTGDYLDRVGEVGLDSTKH